MFCRPLRRRGLSGHAGRRTGCAFAMSDAIAQRYPCFQPPNSAAARSTRTAVRWIMPGAIMAITCSIPISWLMVETLQAAGCRRAGARRRRRRRGACHLHQAHGDAAQAFRPDRLSRRRDRSRRHFAGNGGDARDGGGDRPRRRLRRDGRAAAALSCRRPGFRITPVLAVVQRGFELHANPARSTTSSKCRFPS